MFIIVTNYKRGSFLNEAWSKSLNASLFASLAKGDIIALGATRYRALASWLSLLYSSQRGYLIKSFLHLLIVILRIQFFHFVLTKGEIELDEIM